MTINADDILIDGATAWLVTDEFISTPGLRININILDRPCDTCDGHGTLLREIAVYGDPLRPCPDCDGTGRHCFTIEVECDKWIKNYHYWSEVFRVHVIDVTERGDGQWAVKLAVHKEET